LIVGTPPPGGGTFRLWCGGGNINSGQRSNSRYRFLLRWPEFIFPPPHHSLKVPSQGGVSFDQTSKLEGNFGGSTLQKADNFRKGQNQKNLCGGMAGQRGAAGFRSSYSLARHAITSPPASDTTSLLLVIAPVRWSISLSVPSWFHHRLLVHPSKVVRCTHTASPPPARRRHAEAARCTRARGAPRVRPTSHRTGPGQRGPVTPEWSSSGKSVVDQALTKNGIGQF